MTDETNRIMPSEQGDPELGGLLSSARLQAGLTQTDVAEKVGVSRQHISNIETGITSPTTRVLRDYLHACGTDLAKFFYGPLPTDQTPLQREYHRKLQVLLALRGKLHGIGKRCAAPDGAQRRGPKLGDHHARPGLIALPPRKGRPASRKGEEDPRLHRS